MAVRKLTVGSLFSGIGGFDLGLERAGFEIAWQVENNEWCQRVLRKHWPSITLYADIRTIDWRNIPAVDLVCGGFPCQPFSNAGKRNSVNDDRYLWPEVIKCLEALRPTWFFGENVPGIINLALDQVCADLESIGYTVWPFCVPACAVDAPHIRQRLWILAHTEKQSIGSRLCADEQDEQWRGRSGDGDSSPRRWPAEPDVGRVAHGIPRRMDRLRGLGNAIVPHIAEALGRMILGGRKEKRNEDAGKR